MLLTYKDYTIVHNATQLKPFRYSWWCLQSYTAQMEPQLAVVTLDHVIIHLRHVTVTVQLYLYIWKESLSMWFLSVVWKRLKTLLFKAVH